MNSKKLYFILVGIVILLAAGLIGGAYFANTLLLGQSKNLIDAKSKSAALELQQTQLTKAKSNVAKYDAISKVARSVVPQDKNQAQTVRELVAIADKNSIKLGNISFPSSTLGATAAPGATGAGATPAPTPTANTNTPNLSQLTPLKSISGVYVQQIIVQSNTLSPIPYEKFVTFLSDLEHNRRTALVSGISLQPDVKDPTRISFTLNLDEYIKP
jgi:hypothetical protein